MSNKQNDKYDEMKIEYLDEIQAETFSIMSTAKNVEDEIYKMARRITETK